MNKQKSISEMRKRCRNVIAVSKAIEIAEPWGLGVDDLPIEHFESGIDMGRRLEMNQTGAGVSVYHLSSVLVHRVGRIPASSGKLGRGSMAEDLTFKNCRILEEAIKDENPDRIEGRAN